MGDDDLAYVIEGASCEDAGCCQDAAESCPTEAISL
jgi:ferredoxin